METFPSKFLCILDTVTIPIFSGGILGNNFSTVLDSCLILPITIHHALVPPLHVLGEQRYGKKRSAYGHNTKSGHQTLHKQPELEWSGTNSIYKFSIN